MKQRQSRQDARHSARMEGGGSAWESQVERERSAGERDGAATDFGKENAANDHADDKEGAVGQGGLPGHVWQIRGIEAHGGNHWAPMAAG